MGAEDRVIRSETKVVSIDDFMNLDEGGGYSVTVKKLTVEQGMEYYQKVQAGEQILFADMVQMLIYGVEKTPFESWDEEKVKWLDRTNRDLLMFIFEEVASFNAPLESGKKKR